MSKIILSDLCRVILLPKDSAYTGKLNDLYREKVHDESFQLLDHFFINEELLHFYKALKKQGYRIYMLTSDAIYADEKLQEFLAPVFEKIFSAKKMGMMKSDVRIFHKVAENLGVATQDIVYVDDAQKYISAAREAECQTIPFLSNDQVIHEIGLHLAGDK